MFDVLLIDDETDISDTIRWDLEDGDKNPVASEIRNIDVANNFFKAREFLSKGTAYSLIISDLQMPSRGLAKDMPNSDIRYNGWVFLYRFILLENSPFYRLCRNTKIILYSAYRQRLEKEYLAVRSQAERDFYYTRCISVDKGNFYNGTGGITKLVKVVENTLIGFA